MHARLQRRNVCRCMTGRKDEPLDVLVYPGQSRIEVSGLELATKDGAQALLRTRSQHSPILTVTERGQQVQVLRNPGGVDQSVYERGKKRAYWLPRKAPIVG